LNFFNTCNSFGELPLHLIRLREATEITGQSGKREMPEGLLMKLNPSTGKPQFGAR